MTRDDFDRIHSVRNDGQIHMGAINLEGLSLEELNVAGGHPALHMDVRSIACKLIVARINRLSGKIALATRLEGDCDRLYEFLPECLRW